MLDLFKLNCVMPRMAEMLQSCDLKDFGEGWKSVPSFHKERPQPRAAALQGFHITAMTTIPRDPVAILLRFRRSYQCFCYAFSISLAIKGS